MAILYQSQNPLDSFFKGLNQGAFQVTVPYLLQLQEQRRKAVQDILASSLEATSPLIYASPEFGAYLKAVGIENNKHIKEFMDNIKKQSGKNKVLPAEANGHIVRNILKSEEGGKADESGLQPLPKTSLIPRAFVEALTGAGAGQSQPTTGTGAPNPTLFDFLQRNLGISMPNMPQPPEMGASSFEINSYLQQAKALRDFLSKSAETMVDAYSKEAAKNAFIVKDFNPRLAQTIIDFFKQNGMDVSPVIKIDANGGVTYDLSRVDPQIAVTAANNLYSHLIKAMENVTNLEKDIITTFANLDKEALSADVLGKFGLNKNEIAQVQGLAEQNMPAAIQLAKKYAVESVSEIVRGWNGIIERLSEQLGINPLSVAFSALKIPLDKDVKPDWSANIFHIPMGNKNYLRSADTGNTVQASGYGVGTPSGVERINFEQSPVGQTLAKTGAYAEARAKDIVNAWKSLPSFEAWSLEDLQREIQKAIDFAWLELTKAGVPDDPDIREMVVNQIRGALIIELTGGGAGLTPDEKEQRLREHWAMVQKKNEEKKKKKEQKTAQPTVIPYPGVGVVGIGNIES